MKLDSRKNLILPRVLLLSILLGIVLIRVPGVADPLLGYHYMRMNDSAAIARNFFENSMNILYPQIDWGGNGPGYVEEAFQLYTFLVAVLCHIFGVSDAVGRGLNLVFYTASAALLFLLARRLSDQKVAIFALFFFGVSPLGIYYGRSFQQDPLTLLCSLAAVHLFLIWIDTEQQLTFLASAVALSIAVLMQPISLYLGLPLIYLCYRRFGWGLLKQWQLWLYAGIAITPAALWYWHAHRLWLEYGNTNGMWAMPWKFGSADILSDPLWYWWMLRRLVFKITTLVGWPLFLLGVILRQPKRNYLLHFWAAGFAIAVLLTAGSQIRHDYYQLPMIAVASIFMGSAANYLWGLRLENTIIPVPLTSKLIVLSLCFLTALASGWAMRTQYRMPPDLADQLGFARQLKSLTKPGSLVILGTWRKRGPGTATAECCRHRELNGRYLGNWPVEFYQSHRKGWSIHYEDWSLEVVQYLRKKGARYFAAYYAQGLKEKSDFLHAMADRYDLLDITDKWVIYRLDK